MADQATTFPIDQLQPNPLQPRGVITPDSLADLVDSIKIHGIIEPLVIAHTPAGYQIIAGERRWRAARIAGLSSVPVLIKETTPQGMLEMAIIENVQRTDLNPVDRAKSFDRLPCERREGQQMVDMFARGLLVGLDDCSQLDLARIHVALEPEPSPLRIDGD